MPVITFDPPATGPQAVAVQDWFRIEYVVGSHLHECEVVGSLHNDAFPCDLTLDPTKPETWARAVYEAGARGRDEDVLPGHWCSYCKQVRPT